MAESKPDPPKQPMPESVPDKGKGLIHAPGPSIEGPADGVLDPHRSRSDLRMLSKAVRLGWDIPEKAFTGLPAEIVNIIALKVKEGSDGTTPESPSHDGYAYSVTARLRAIETLRRMSKDNDERESSAALIDAVGKSREPVGLHQIILNVESQKRATVIGPEWIQLQVEDARLAQVEAGLIEDTQPDEEGRDDDREEV